MADILFPTTVRFTQDELKRLDAMPGKSRSDKIKNLLNQKSVAEMLSDAQKRPLESISIQVAMLSKLVEKNASQEAQKVPISASQESLTLDDFRATMARFADFFSVAYAGLEGPKTPDGRNAQAARIAREIKTGKIVEESKK